MKSPYRFEPLNAGNLADYLAVALNCGYSFARDVEPSLLECYLRDAASGKTVIYEGKNPVAVFSGEKTVERIGGIPVPVNYLRAHSSGLLIADEYMEQAEAFKEFVVTELFEKYYLKTLHIDYISLINPPKIALTMPEKAFQFIPFYNCMIDVNSLVYAKLGEDLLNSFKYNTRYETKKGLQALNKLQIFRDKEINVQKHIMPLVLVQAEELGLKPKPPEHFKGLLKCKYHHVLAAVQDNRPLSAIIYTCVNGVATFNFNASSQDAKKMFVNKGLLYTAMKESFDMGAEYFALGDGKEFSGKMLNVCFFKRSFSTHEAANYRFIYPLSFLGHILTGFRQFKKTGAIMNALTANRRRADIGNG